MKNHSCGTFLYASSCRKKKCSKISFLSRSKETRGCAPRVVVHAAKWEISFWRPRFARDQRLAALGAYPSHWKALLSPYLMRKFRNTFSSCMMRRIWKCHRGDFSEKTTNQAFLCPAKTALTIFLKFCIPPYFGLIFLMKKIFDPPKRIMTSFWGSKNPENQFFRPKSDIFHPISMKLSKSV